MSELKRLQNQLEQLERSYKLGIISENEYKKGKDNLNRKIEPLLEEKKKSEESKKIIDEVLSEKPGKKASEKKTETTSKKEKQADKKTEEKKTPKEPEKAKEKTAKEDKKTKSEEKKPEKAKEKKTAKEDKKKAEEKKADKKEKTPEKKKQKKTKDKKQKRNWKGTFWTILLILVIIVALYMLFRGPESEEQYIIPEKNLTGVDKTISLEFYTSYACQYCAETDSIMRNIEEVYGDNVEVERIHYPYNLEIDYDMDRAAVCAEQAGDERNYSKRLYEAKKPIPKEDLVVIAGELGMNTTEFEQCMQDNETARTVLTDYKRALDKKINSIPKVYISGGILTGAKPAYYYEYLIDEELF
ncbi:MAG: DsbA family protein [Candidatus Nanoarchaeia archaeon]